VKTALTSAQSRISALAPAIYLQGSYRNATNIVGDSDVDVVVELESTFRRDVSRLDSTQEELQKSAYAPSNLTWADFRADVLQTLRDYYTPARVEESDKCVKVTFGLGRIAADIVPALQLRKYDYFYTTALQSSTDGIYFENRARISITNFPKQHISNGEAKNGADRTNGWYKPTVRMFKNARNRLLNDNLLAEGDCPSYCIECLIYNAADYCFGPTYQETYRKVLDYLWKLPFNSTLSQNGIIPLFGPSPVQWNMDTATKVLAALRNLSANWR
jgi:hypothetical protein